MREQTSDTGAMNRWVEAPNREPIATAPLRRNHIVGTATPAIPKR